MNRYTKPYYFLFTLPIAIVGYFNNWAELIIFAEVIFAALCIYSDYSNGVKSISFITVYSAFTLVYCFGNFLVVNSVGTAEASMYDYYLIPENISLALFFTYCANVFCVLGFYYYKYSYTEIPGPIATMNIPLTKKRIKQVNVLITVLNVLVFFQKVPYELLFPTLITILFFVTRYAVKHDDKSILTTSVINVYILTLNGLLFNYLRMWTVAPSIAFLIAVLFGRGQISAFFRRSNYPIYLLLFMSLTVFSFLGKIRNQASGYEKLTSVIDKLTVNKDDIVVDPYVKEEEESFAARVSNINQTSQIVRVVDEDGYYKGTTLAYLSYAFIPRAIWKEKPIIAQGVWFAVRIGQAYVNEMGQSNNSINMTCAGELFLNFGIIGVAVGMFFIGILCGYMWHISGFIESDNNVLGGMFGLYLFYLATSTFGIDLQFLVTLFSYFTFFQILNYIYIYFTLKKESNA